jgi:hypothetical protein
MWWLHSTKRHSFTIMVWWLQRHQRAISELTDVMIATASTGQYLTWQIWWLQQHHKALSFSLTWMVWWLQRHQRANAARYWFGLRGLQG